MAQSDIAYSVVIAGNNEEKAISQTIKDLFDPAKGELDRETIVVNDGSTDLRSIGNTYFMQSVLAGDSNNPRNQPPHCR